MKTESTSILYINGFGNKLPNLTKKFIFFCWRNYNVKFCFTDIDWLDGETFECKKNKIKEIANKIISENGKIILFGLSAGGSLALNVFKELSPKDVFFVSINGCLHLGNYSNDDKGGIFEKNKIKALKSSPAFLNSVINLEKNVIPNLSDEDKKRMLIFRPLIDSVVPKHLMKIEKVRTVNSLLIGHDSSMIYHTNFNKKTICDCMEKAFEK